MPAVLAYEARPAEFGRGWSALRSLAWCVAALHLLMTAGVWLATLRTLGVSCVRVSPRIFRLSLRASLIREVSALLLLPLAIAAASSAYGVGRWYLAALPLDAALLVALLYFTQLLIPPTALVFSSSTDRQLRWALELKKFTAGRRVISLLDTGYMSLRLTPRGLLSRVGLGAGTLTDILRTSETGGWQEGVRELIDITPIVIVDTRVTTRALLFEASAALAPEHAHKAVFVSDDDGACPVLARLLEEGRLPSGRALNVVRECELGPLLQRMVASRDALPKPGRVVSDTTTTAESVARRAAGRQVEPPAARAPFASGPTAAVFRPSGGRRLSSSLTPFWRLAALAAVPHLLLTTAAGLWLASTPQLFSSHARGFVWALLGVNCAAWAVYYYMARPLKKVTADGDLLLVSNYSREVPIHLSQVSRVSGPDWTSLRRITLHLHGPSAFGQKIVFAGRLFSAGNVARELRRRLYSLAEEAGRANTPRG